MCQCAHVVPGLNGQADLTLKIKIINFILNPSNGHVTVSVIL